MNFDYMEFFARWKLRFTRGLAYTSVPMTLFGAISMAFLWKPYLDMFSIPTWMFYIGAPFGYMLITLGVGYKDDKKEIWRKETDHFNATQNPYHIPLTKMFKDVEDIKAALEESGIIKKEGDVKK